MEIAAIITGGILLMVAFASFFDFLGKRKKKSDKALEAKVDGLEKRMLGLEERLVEKDDKITRLENDISFVNRLIEGKEKQGD
jgi:septal ring factor EnvC (AmiA/AmiB activator)